MFESVLEPHGNQSKIIRGLQSRLCGGVAGFAPFEPFFVRFDGTVPLEAATAARAERIVCVGGRVELCCSVEVGDKTFFGFQSCPLIFRCFGLLGRRSRRMDFPCSGRFLAGHGKKFGDNEGGKVRCELEFSERTRYLLVGGAMRFRTIFCAVLCAVVFSFASFSQSDSEQKGIRFSVVLEGAFYPSSERLHSAEPHFSMLDGFYNRVEGRALFSAAYKIPIGSRRGRADTAHHCAVHPCRFFSAAVSRLFCRSVWWKRLGNFIALRDCRVGRGVAHL